MADLTERFMSLKSEFQVLLDQEMEDVDQPDGVEGQMLDSKAQQKMREELIFEIDA